MSRKDRSLVLATGNPGKIREMRRVLSDLRLEIKSLADFGDVPEAIEDGETFAENARKKALHYAEQTGHWCLADDSGLAVDALDGRPGVHSARYAADRVESDRRDDIDQANNEKLLEELRDIPDEQRTARFVCYLAFAEPGAVLLETRGTVEGRIGYEPAGENGFGYDPLFYLPDRACTTAQLLPEEKNAISHRGKAVRRFADLLEDFLARQG
ncbi:MAG: XTP/dITP diphosphatase [Phycisphaerae bacterium]